MRKPNVINWAEVREVLTSIDSSNNKLCSFTQDNKGNTVINFRDSVIKNPIYPILYGSMIENQRKKNGKHTY